MIVWMFIKYFFHPLPGSEDRGEESSNYDVPQSLSERERERERESNLESDAGGSLYSQYRVQSAVSHQFSSNCLLMGQEVCFVT